MVAFHIIREPLIARRAATQHEIAARMGVTQMTVSRRLTRILAQLRSTVGSITLG